MLVHFESVWTACGVLLILLVIPSPAWAAKEVISAGWGVVVQVAERAVQQLRTPLVASSEVGSLPTAGTDLVEPAATGLTPVSTVSGIGTIPEVESHAPRSPGGGLLLGSAKPPVSDGQIPGRPAGLRVEVTRGSSRPPRVGSSPA